MCRRRRHRLCSRGDVGIKCLSCASGDYSDRSFREHTMPIDLSSRELALRRADGGFRLRRRAAWQPDFVPQPHRRSADRRHPVRRDLWRGIIIRTPQIAASDRQRPTDYPHACELTFPPVPLCVEFGRRGKWGARMNKVYADAHIRAGRVAQGWHDHHGGRFRPVRHPGSFDPLRSGTPGSKT